MFKRGRRTLPQRLAVLRRREAGHDAGSFRSGIAGMYEIHLPLEMGAQVVVVARAEGSDEYLGLLSYALGG